LSFSNGQSYYNTTNTEMMHSSSVPDFKLHKISRNDGRVNLNMKNHHFDFGKAKPSFKSTFSSSFVPHAIPGIFWIK
jgi:hypothetical protein